MMKICKQIAIRSDVLQTLHKNKFQADGFFGQNFSIFFFNKSTIEVTFVTIFQALKVLT